MIAIPSSLLALGGIVAIALALFGAGCSVGSARVERKYQIRDEAAKQIAERTSKALAEHQNEIERLKNAGIAIDIAKRDALIAGLRRNAARLPETARVACAGSTGFELATADAGFLIGEAAESMKWQRALLACYAREDELRAAMLGK